eukprot:321960-Chlamydomonas_euryale.AAC.2
MTMSQMDSLAALAIACLKPTDPDAKSAQRHSTDQPPTGSGSSTRPGAESVEKVWMVVAVSEASLARAVDGK